MTFSILTALQGVMQCHAVRGACAWCGPLQCDCSTAVAPSAHCSRGLLSHLIALQPLVLSDANMLIRVHDESFVLFFYNSFILLDKKPLMLVVAFLTGGQTVDTRYISIDISVARRPDDGHVHVQQDHQAVPCRQHSAVTTSVVATTFRNCCVMKLDIGNQNFQISTLQLPCHYHLSPISIHNTTSIASQPDLSSTQSLVLYNNSFVRPNT